MSRKKMMTKSPNFIFIRNKKFILWFLCLSLSGSLLYCKEPESKDRPLVAVMPFTYKSSTEHAGIEKGLADALAAELVKTKKFRMIERERVHALLQETVFQQTGVVDSKTAVQIGKQLGAKAYVLGAIASVSVQDEWRSVKFAEKTVRRADIEAEAKLVDVETGEMLAAGRAIGKAKTAEKHAFGGKIGELSSKESVVQKAMQNLAEKLSRDLAKSYSGK